MESWTEFNFQWICSRYIYIYLIYMGSLNNRTGSGTDKRDVGEDLYKLYISIIYYIWLSEESAAMGTDSG